MTRGRIALLSAACAALLTGCGDVGTEPQTPPRDMPRQTMRDVRLTETKDGVAQWTLTAPAASESADGTRMTVTRPRLVILESDGRIASTVTAASATVVQGTQDIAARGGVAIRSRDGLVVEAESLGWQNQSRRLTTAAAVRIRRHGSVVTGQGFESDASLHQYRILSGLHAEVTEDELDE